MAACALVCASLAAAPAPAGPPALALSAAHGALRISSSHAGGAIVEAANMRPGQSAAGTVTVANRGRGPGRLLLASSPARDRPGPGGGRLSRRLDLAVDEDRERLAAGSVNSLAGCHPLGRIAAGESRTFSFTIRFRGGSEADNSYALSSAAVDVRWLATEHGGCARRGRQEVLAERRDAGPRAAVPLQLPFTGLELMVVAVSGVFMLTSGLALRRRLRAS
jgi:hypothetical protein